MDADYGNNQHIILFHWPKMPEEMNSRHHLLESLLDSCRAGTKSVQIFKLVPRGICRLAKGGLQNLATPKLHPFCLNHTN